jgi:phosphatidylserine/phosphatidylglycerophosphate/cardiolipin synthase-like enzyme
VENLGSDIKYLAENGVPCRTDDAKQYHMHNKFVIVDDAYLLTGSFNWTVQAGLNNQENLLVVDAPYYIEKYNTEFEKLWKNFESNDVDAK